VNRTRHLTVQLYGRTRTTVRCAPLITRTPQFKARNRAHVAFYSWGAYVNCAGVKRRISRPADGVRGVPWEQGTPTGTVWHRSRPAPAPERVSHCTLAHSQLGSLASIKGRAGSKPTHPIVFSHLAHHPIRGQAVRLTPPVANGRPLTGLGRTRGRGSGSHLTRAFAGSKPLYPALPTAP